jgi:hypothetical protein
MVRCSVENKNLIARVTYREIITLGTYKEGYYSSKPYDTPHNMQVLFMFNFWGIHKRVFCLSETQTYAQVSDVLPLV